MKAIEFDWDEGNRDKNQKHKIDDQESEEVFLDREKVIYKDPIHSVTEDTFILLGKTKRDRLLYTVYTIRNHKIRIISSRDINKKEVRLYEKKAQDTKV